jgi:hypothetical protein
MVSGNCEEKYIPVKKIFENYFAEQEEFELHLQSISKENH